MEGGSADVLCSFGGGFCNHRSNRLHIVHVAMLGFWFNGDLMVYMYMRSDGMRPVMVAQASLYYILFAKAWEHV